MAKNPLRSAAAYKAWATIRRQMLTGTSAQPTPKPTERGTAAAKKAWNTRKKNEAKAEQERLEAIRILDELAKNRKS